MVTTPDRVEIARAVAKAIAHKNAGNDAQAEAWARQIVELLACHNILKDA